MGYSSVNQLVVVYYFSLILLHVATSRGVERKFWGEGEGVEPPFMCVHACVCMYACIEVYKCKIENFLTVLKTKILVKGCHPTIPSLVTPVATNLSP